MCYENLEYDTERMSESKHLILLDLPLNIYLINSQGNLVMDKKKTDTIHTVDTNIGAMGG